jgi:hypothetical protein
MHPSPRPTLENPIYLQLFHTMKVRHLCPSQMLAVYRSPDAKSDQRLPRHLILAEPPLEPALPLIVAVL